MKSGLLAIALVTSTCATTYGAAAFAENSPYKLDTPDFSFTFPPGFPAANHTSESLKNAQVDKYESQSSTGSDLLITEITFQKPQLLPHLNLTANRDTILKSVPNSELNDEKAFYFKNNPAISISFSASKSGTNLDGRALLVSARPYHFFEVMCLAPAGSKVQHDEIKTSYKSLTFKMASPPVPKSLHVTSSAFSFMPPPGFKFDKLVYSERVFSDAESESFSYFDKQGHSAVVQISHFNKDITDPHSKLPALTDSILELLDAEPGKQEFLTYDNRPALSTYFKPRKTGGLGRALFVNTALNLVYAVVIWGDDDQFVDSAASKKSFDSLKVKPVPGATDYKPSPNH
jgi:hypothetical protein